MKLPHTTAHQSLIASKTIFLTDKYPISIQADIAQDIAGKNLEVLATYSEDIYKNLEKRCSRDVLGGSQKDINKQLRKCMRKFLIDCGLANEVAPGHGSSKPKKGKGIQKSTQTFLDDVAKCLKQ